jgi:predicted alpha/beta-fold hydrolase
MLHEKIQMKMKVMPERIDDTGFQSIKTFQDFDDRYTAPIHGFKDALDYWNRASCKPFLPHIPIPALLVNAADDPFLPEPCYPVSEAEANPFFCLEIPESGGHVGFVQFNARGEYWSESRAVSFIEH